MVITEIVAALIAVEEMLADRLVIVRTIIDANGETLTTVRRPMGVRPLVPPLAERNSRGLRRSHPPSVPDPSKL